LRGAGDARRRGQHLPLPLGAGEAPAQAAVVAKIGGHGAARQGIGSRRQNHELADVPERNAAPAELHPQRLALADRRSRDADVGPAHPADHPVERQIGDRMGEAAVVEIVEVRQLIGRQGAEPDDLCLLEAAGLDQALDVRAQLGAGRRTGAGLQGNVDRRGLGRVGRLARKGHEEPVSPWRCGFERLNDGGPAARGGGHGHQVGQQCRFQRRVSPQNDVGMVEGSGEIVLFEPAGEQPQVAVMVAQRPVAGKGHEAGRLALVTLGLGSERQQHQGPGLKRVGAQRLPGEAAHLRPVNVFSCGMALRRLQRRCRMPFGHHDLPGDDREQGNDDALRNGAHD
jgi:hypothetical protein